MEPKFLALFSGRRWTNEFKKIKCRLAEGCSMHGSVRLVSPRARVVPRPLTDLDPETAKLIEDITIDSKGRAVPKLYSKLQANKELRAFLNLSAKSEAPDVTKLSDADLIAQLAQQAKELGIEIDLNYTFAQPKKTDE
jgi:hypothetical protein